jgi:hypothetical protein
MDSWEVPFSDPSKAGYYAIIPNMHEELGRTFFYFFDSNFTASWTFAKPVSNALAPLTFDDTATVTFDDAKSLTLKWSKTGSVEKFSAVTEASLVGTWNAAEPLIAAKMF